jgi:hypothetical protein
MQVAATIYPRRSVVNIFATGYMILITGLEWTLECGCLALFGHLSYVEITKFSILKILCSCRLSTGAQVYFVYSYLYNHY